MCVYVYVCLCVRAHAHFYKRLPGIEFYLPEHKGKINQTLLLFKIAHLPSVLRQPNALFMQDKAPCHNAKSALRILEEEGIAVMKQPPKRPDMNIQEEVWKTIWAEVQDRNPQNIDDLWGFLKKKKTMGKYHLHVL